MSETTDNNAEFIKEFLIESHENLDKIVDQLLTLEKNPASPAPLAEIFRAFHTIKGTGRFFNLAKIETLTHFGEDLLSRLRDGRLAFHRGCAEALLALSDGVRTILKSLETTGQEGSLEVEALVKTLRPRAESPGGGALLREEGAAEAAPAVADTTLRVEVQVLDRLMGQIGELVLARNHLLQRAAFSRDPAVAPAVQRLNFITADLQNQLMKMRLQPIAGLWAKLPRLVRDLSVALGKEAQLFLEGGETELDKSVLESIKDPLTHLVRNAVDHGLEAPEKRRAAGKPVAGEIRLRAFHEGGVVHMEISDDGAGLSLDAIRRKALEKNLISPASAERLTDADVARLVFLPGLSTAPAVTNLSGRGVGLDVVKTNVEKIGGSVEVRSAPGRGCSFHLKIPLTLAILPALVVSSRGLRYAVPQSGLLELVRLRPGVAGQDVEWVQGAAVFRRRGRLLPVVFLNKILHGSDNADPAMALLVLQIGPRRFGLAVEHIVDTEEIVVKPLGRHLKSMNLFEGATVLGDGAVVLILDIPGLADHGGVAATELAAPAFGDALSAPKPAGEPHLLLAGPDDGRLALPLSRVLRLERISLAALERVGSEEILPYRQGPLRIVRLTRLLPERRKSARRLSPENPDQAHVVVCVSGGQPVGVAVHRILDIVDEIPADTRPGGRPGVRSTVIVRGRVTELLDLDALLAGPAGSP